jgi:hypothetical protein
MTDRIAELERIEKSLRDELDDSDKRHAGEIAAKDAEIAKVRKDWSDACDDCDGLNAQIRAKDAEIELLRSMLSVLKGDLAIERETWTDENGTVWNRPTAWAYQQACRTIRSAEQRAESAESRVAELEHEADRWRTAHDAILAEAERMVTEAQQCAREAVEAAERELKEARTALIDIGPYFIRDCARLVGLEDDALPDVVMRELQEARRDTKRLNFWEANPRAVTHSTGYRGAKDSWVWRDQSSYAHFDADELRAAIDAARSVSPEPAAAEEDGERCECCGAPATKYDVEGVPLCDGDYDELVRQSAGVTPEGPR